MMHPSNHVVLLLVGLLAVTGSLFADMPDTYRMVFKLYVEEDGIYRVTFDQLGICGPVGCLRKFGHRRGQQANTHLDTGRRRRGIRCGRRSGVQGDALERALRTLQ